MSAQPASFSNLSEKQEAFVDTDADRAAFIGGRQSGKTTALGVIAVAHANDGREVVAGAPKLDMAKRLMEQIKKEHIKRVSASITKMVPGEIKLSSGGVITATSFSNFPRGQSLSPDVLLIDEFNDLRDIKQANMHIVNPNKFYAAATPRNCDLPFLDSSWDIVLAPTLSNPAVKPQHVDSWAKSTAGNARRRMMKPIRAGDHGLFPVKLGLGVDYRCMFCDFSERLKDDVSAEHHKYVIGKAIEQDCL